MQERARRIDGWKAIGAYVGRNRSTVIRWANSRGLPIHAVPGGNSNRTVYALTDELDAWMRGDAARLVQCSPAADETVEPDDDPAAVIGTDMPGRNVVTSARRGLPLRLIVASGGLLAVATVVLGMLPSARPASARASDVDLLQAHDLVAERSTRSLSSATALLRRLSAAFPDDARPEEALAEATLLGREFGTMSDPAAFAAARVASERALHRDPTAATAWRSLGYVRYWGDHRPEEAGPAFRRAIRLAPNDPLAHLWYANALADTGESKAAERQMETARSLNPGQPYMLADAAWARWNAGHMVEARATLERLAADHPEVASIDDCLSVVLLSIGDLTGYSRHLRRRADDRASQALVAYSQLVEGAVSRGDRNEVYRLILSHALNVADTTTQTDHSFATFVAATFGDRTAVEKMVKSSIADGERWGSFGYRSRILARWPEDRRLASKIDRLAISHLE